MAARDEAQCWFGNRGGDPTGRGALIVVIYTVNSETRDFKKRIELVKCSDIARYC